MAYDGLPSFATPVDAKLVLETDDRTQADFYDVTMTVTMLIPEDYTRTTFIETARSVSLPFFATDPCSDTQLDSFAMDDVSISV